MVESAFFILIISNSIYSFTRNSNPFFNVSSPVILWQVKKGILNYFFGVRNSYFMRRVYDFRLRKIDRYRQSQEDNKKGFLWERRIRQDDDYFRVQWHPIFHPHSIHSFIPFHPLHPSPHDWLNNIIIVNKTNK